MTVLHNIGMAYFYLKQYSPALDAFTDQLAKVLAFKKDRHLTCRRYRENVGICEAEDLVSVLLQVFCS